MLPDQKQFRDQMKHLRVKLSDQVVFYTNAGNMQAGRAYWMLKAYGHKNVSILNGGLKKWTSEGRATESTADMGAEKDYEYVLDQS